MSYLALLRVAELRCAGGQMSHLFQVISSCLRCSDESPFYRTYPNLAWRVYIIVNTTFNNLTNIIESATNPHKRISGHALLCANRKPESTPKPTGYSVWYCLHYSENLNKLHNNKFLHVRLLDAQQYAIIIVMAWITSKLWRISGASWSSGLIRQ